METKGVFLGGAQEEPAGGNSAHSIVPPPLPPRSCPDQRGGDGACPGSAQGSGLEGVALPLETSGHSLDPSLSQREVSSKPPPMAVPPPPGESVHLMPTFLFS